MNAPTHPIYINPIPIKAAMPVNKLIAKPPILLLYIQMVVKCI